MELKKELSLMKKLSNKIMGHLVMSVKADEPNTGEQKVPTTEPVTGTAGTQTSSTPVVPSTPQLNFEQLVAQARKEEKEKLYPKINELKLSVGDRDKKINELMLALGSKEAEIGTLRAELDKAKSGVTNSEEVTSLQTTVAQLQKDLADEKARCNSIELDYYKKAKIAEVGGQLIPELVNGQTKEEIDQSIEISKARFAEILGGIQAQKPQQASPVNDANAFLAGGINPSTSHLNQTNVADELASIDVRTVEGRKRYAEIRKQMGII